MPDIIPDVDNPTVITAYVIGIISFIAIMLSVNKSHEMVSSAVDRKDRYNLAKSFTDKFTIFIQIITLLVAAYFYTEYSTYKSAFTAINEQYTQQLEVVENLKKDIDDIKEKLKSISELAHTEYEAIRQQTIQFKNSPNVVEEIQTRFLKKEKKDVQNK